jgi:beta-fructofuranosidase
MKNCLFIAMAMVASWPCLAAEPKPDFRFDSPSSRWGPPEADGQFPHRDAGLFRSVFDVPGMYVNDHCLIHARGAWHLFFIQGEVSKPGEVWYRPGNEAKIGHATSADLLHWKLLEPALATNKPGTLDCGHVFAPFVIENEGKYYMYYAGNVVGLGSSRIFLAVSDDLTHWQRHPHNPVVVSDPRWAAYRPEGYLGGPAGPVGCRDPHVIRHPQHGFILYFADWMKADAGRGSGDLEFACIAAATSRDLVHWQDRGPVLVRRQTGVEKMAYAAPESPCVIHRNGQYYLFWKGGNGTRYTISHNPLDFRDREAYFLGTCHASEIFEWHGTWFATSCSRRVDDVSHAASDRSLGLFLAGIEWDGLWPRLRRITAP